MDRKAWCAAVHEVAKSRGRNINNLRYADETTLMAESKEGLKSLLMKVKEVGSTVTQPGARDLSHL